MVPTVCGTHTSSEEVPRPEKTEGHTVGPGTSPRAQAEGLAPAADKLRAVGLRCGLVFSTIPSRRLHSLLSRELRLYQWSRSQMSQQPGRKLYLPHQPGKQPRLLTVAPAPYLNMLRAPHLLQ